MRLTSARPLAAGPDKVPRATRAPVGCERELRHTIAEFLLASNDPALLKSNFTPDRRSPFHRAPQPIHRTAGCAAIIANLPSPNTLNRGKPTHRNRVRGARGPLEKEMTIRVGAHQIQRPSQRDQLLRDRLNLDHLHHHRLAAGGMRAAAPPRPTLSAVRRYPHRLCPCSTTRPRPASFRLRPG